MSPRNSFLKSNRFLVSFIVIGFLALLVLARFADVAPGSIYAQLQTACSDGIDNDGDGQIDVWKEVGSFSVEHNVEDGVAGVIRDGYAYYASSSVPPLLVKVRLSDFKKVNVINLKASGYANNVMLSPDGATLYVGVSLFEKSYVVPVDLKRFRVMRALSYVDPDGNQTKLLAVQGNYVYLGVRTNPGRIVKIDLKSGAVTSSLTLQQNEELIDLGYVYQSATKKLFVGAYTTSGSSIIKINLATMQREGAIIAGGADNAFESAVLEGNIAYFLGGTDLVKVSLSPLVQLEIADLPDALFQLQLDPAKSHAYGISYGRDGNSASISTIRLSNLQVTKKHIFGSGEVHVGGLLTDGPRDALYVFPSSAYEARHVKFALNDRECESASDTTE